MGTTAPSFDLVGTYWAPDHRVSGPSAESGTNGTLDGRVSEALESVQSRPDRDPTTGRFLTGNTAAGRTLARSEALWSELSTLKGGLADQLRADLAIEDGKAAETLAGLVDAYCEARLLRMAMFKRMTEQGGPVTGKGRVRAIFSTYLSALDRETKLATTLGLERRQKAVPSLQEALAAVDVEEDTDHAK